MSTPLPVRPPLDPELVPVIEAIRQALGFCNQESLPRLRDVMTHGVEGTPQVDLTAGGAVDVTERTVPGSDSGPALTLLVLSPATGRGPWPAIYHTHGGGMVLGDRRSGVETYLPYVTEVGAVVVSVEYRLAPEHPDPAPVEDCYAGLVWTARHTEELRIDPERILIAGSGGGGGLAAGTALLARDRGFPTLARQILISPMIDDRCETPSSRMLRGDGFWDHDENLFAWTALLGDRRGGDEVSIYAAPARATDLSGLPRTYVDVGTVETFRDEAVAYAARLAEAGVPVDLHMWGGAFHSSDTMAPHATISRASLAVRDEFIRRALEV